MSEQTFERRMNRREASEYLTRRGYRVAVNTLAKYASMGGGPVFESFGRTPLYTERALLAWVAGRMQGKRDF